MPSGANRQPSRKVSPLSGAGEGVGEALAVGVGVGLAANSP